MVKKKEIYKCDACGSIVEVLHGGNGSLFCCNKPMVLFLVKQRQTKSKKSLYRSLKNVWRH